MKVQSAATKAMADPAAQADVVAIYGQTADFVWRTLQRLGVPAQDLEDLMQEVYVVVHRQIAGFRQESKLTTWLFSICLRVASRHRKRAYFRREQQVASVPESVDTHTPEQAADTRERTRRLERILSTLTLEQRAVFVMFEIEGFSCQEIAELSGVPTGTVYSRLHTARRRVETAISKLRSADRKEAFHE